MTDIKAGDTIKAVECDARGEFQDWACGTVSTVDPRFINFSPDSEGTCYLIHHPDSDTLPKGWAVGIYSPDGHTFDTESVHFPQLGVIDGIDVITAPTVEGDIKYVGDFEGVQFEDTEEVVESSTGGKKGQKAARYSYIPTDSLNELAIRYGKGAERYPTNEVDGVDNWRKGYDWSLTFDAAYRHLTAAMSGEDIDPDTGDKHATAVAWHMFALIHWMNDLERFGGFDDRQAKAEDRLANREKNRDMIEAELKEQMDPDAYAARMQMLGKDV